MSIKKIAPQLRTTDMDSTVRFYTEKLGFAVDFNYEGFYAGLSSGGHVIHLKHVDEKDPSIPFVDEGGHLHLYFEVDGVVAFADTLKAKGVELAKDVHETDWNTREFIVHDDQGHTLYFGEAVS
ncbi:MAG TPA: VOC family protein [Pyrinomonadaceae bacterium]|nr:VOC family protein [Pyrinomonadaceae bacterium]